MPKLRSTLSTKASSLSSRWPLRLVGQRAGSPLRPMALAFEPRAVLSFGALLAVAGCASKGLPAEDEAKAEAEASKKTAVGMTKPRLDLPAAKLAKPAAENPAPTAEESTPNPPVAWESLHPIALVALYKDSAASSIPEPNRRFRKKYPRAYMDEAKSFRSNSRAVPARAKALAKKIWLLPGRVHPAPQVREFFYSASPFGDQWTAVFDWPHGNGEHHPDDAMHGLALDGWPHTSANPRQPTASQEASGDVRRALVAGTPLAFAPGPKQAVSYAKVDAQLPPPATQVLAGYWNDEEYGDPTYGVVVTADEAGNYVETISKHRDDLMWASISFVADIDDERYRRSPVGTRRGRRRGVFLDPLL